MNHIVVLCLQIGLLLEQTAQDGVFLGHLSLLVDLCHLTIVLSLTLLQLEGLQSAQTFVRRGRALSRRVSTLLLRCFLRC